jgi:hypothetical protein
MMRSALVLSLTLSLLVVGCSSDTVEKKECPAKGIGVQSAAGISCSTASADPENPTYKAAVTDCSDQVSNYKNYLCSDPQICYDLGVRIVPDFVVDPMGTGENVVFVITNCSSGNKKLTISKVLIVGDSRCSYGEAEVASKELDPGKEMLIRTVYKPKAPGVDMAGIHIFSDAANYKPLTIALCGRALAKYKPGADSGVSGVDAATNKALRCSDPATMTVNKTCHAE